MNYCGYNVLPIITDQLNLYNVLWQCMAGRCGARSGMARADNSRLSILKSAPSSVRHGRASLGTVRRGGDRQGTARKGAAWYWKQSIGYWQQYHFEC
jgi:hypothetical protein